MDIVISSQQAFEFGFFFSLGATVCGCIAAVVLGIFQSMFS